MNKKLLVIIILLIPITIISFCKKETNFIMPKNTITSINNNYVDVLYKNKIIKLKIDDYIIGVVAGEMPASFNIEALKAQAVASRTYYYNKKKVKNVMSSTTSDQVYISKEEMKLKWSNDYDKYYEKIKEAVISTKNEIITYNNDPIISYYYAKSNGYSEDSVNVFNEQYPYLKSVVSPEEDFGEETKILSTKDFLSILNINADFIVLSEENRDESHRISSIIINNKKFSGTQIRNLLSLKSTDFEITEKDNNVYVKTKGYGHGVGMSQYGANELAKKGYNYYEILTYYYKDTKISKM